MFAGLLKWLVMYSRGIELLDKILNLRWTVMPVTKDNVVLIRKMEDDAFLEGEHHITECGK